MVISTCDSAIKICLAYSTNTSQCDVINAAAHNIIMGIIIDNWVYMMICQEINFMVNRDFLMSKVLTSMTSINNKIRYVSSSVLPVSYCSPIHGTVITVWLHTLINYYPVLQCVVCIKELKMCLLLNGALFVVN